MAPDEDTHSLEAKFVAAVKVIQSFPEEGPFQPSDDMMLMFDGYYKQATLGPCNISRPNGFWDPSGKAKWDAWRSLGNMTKKEAMENYVEDIQRILETIPMSDEVSDLVKKLGNFYAESDREGEEEEENEVDRRPFTRPFANSAGGLIKQFVKPTMEGYGDLWDDIQNLGGDDSSVVSGEEAEGSNGNSEFERKVESCDWRKSEEEENGDEEDNAYDEDKEEEEDEEKEWRPDPRLLMVEKRMRSETWGSSSSMEPSMYSFTNGTHSSLNSEVEEEELAFCLEPSVQCNSNMHFNGHLSGQTDAFPEVKHRSDSDNEEFCDSMDHLAVEEGPSSSKIHSPGSGAASVRQRDLCYESSTTLKGREDQVLVGASYLKEGISSSQHNSSVSRRERGSQSPRTTCSSHRCTSVDPARRGVSQSGHPTSSARGDVNEQIATALLRLQRDMASVLQRLHALEGLSVSQGKPPTQVSTTSRSSSPRPEDSLPVAKMFLRPSWWPFDFSPLTAVLTALWPPIAHWLVQLYLQRRRRKIT
ncbi:acyl-CoA-binding domain-containing protein 5A-like isoform X1 [Pungitius pungitius]|uniref:acyl-CoA-binding domain-containing protein 5A-like isoform X1 n=1 Tax=Pungitius pungitius TaxID=134920 RepID=UPI002E0F70EE